VRWSLVLCKRKFFLITKNWLFDSGALVLLNGVERKKKLVLAEQNKKKKKNPRPDDSAFQFCGFQFSHVLRIKKNLIFLFYLKSSNLISMCQGVYVVENSRLERF
jgi:hypothetical protein